jgi:hypothetical protein
MRKVLLLYPVVVLLLAAGRAPAPGDARAVIEKAIQASGGAENLAKLNAAHAKFKGTIEVMGMTLDVTGDNYVQLPGRSKTVFNLDLMGQKIKVTEVVDKDKAWSRTDITGQTEDIKGAALESAREQGYRDEAETLVPLLNGKAFTLTLIGDVKINDRTAVGIKVASKGHKDFNLFFDKQNGLLVKQEGPSVNDSGKAINREILYSDYKAFDGVQRPTKILMKEDGKKALDVEVTEWTFPKKIEDSEFAK